jgi:transcription initiation factor IIF auxiliary subunit
MNLNYQNMSDDWGWFIDIENNSFVHDYYEVRKTINKLQVIKEEEEDDYDYYKQMYKDPEEIYINRETGEKHLDIYTIESSSFKFYSKTIITIATAYILLSVINLDHSI